MRRRLHPLPARRRPSSVLGLALALLAQSGIGAGVGRARPATEPGVTSPVSALERALGEAEAAIRDNELAIAESRYRSALLEGWLLLGSLAIEDGDLLEARTAFERAVTVSVETLRPLTSLGLVMLELGETEEALEVLRGIVIKNPAGLDARRLLSRALVASGRVGEAIQELEQLRALAPENLENAFLLATAYLQADRPEAAQPLFDELTRARPIPATWVLIGRVLRDSGNYERARQALERALELDPGVPRAHYYLGSIDLLDQGRGMLEEAMAHFEAELEVAPEDPVTNLYLGICLVETRRHEEAVARLQAASRLGASQRDALQYLGRSYLALGRPEDAVPAFRRALELAAAEPVETPEGVYVDLDQSQIASIHYQLALALRRMGDEDAARVHFEASKRYSARVAESSRELLGRYLESETRKTRSGAGISLLGSSPLAALPAEVRRTLGDRVTRAVARAYFDLGVILVRNEHHGRAARLFEQAAALEPEFPRVQYSLGVARFNAAQFERAAEALAKARASSPEDVELRRMLALAWLNSGSHENAAALLRDDEERATNGSLQYAYGLALVRSGRAAEAESVFAELLEANADWPELNVFLGQAHAQQDDYSSAIRLLTRAIELDPEVAEAHSTLGDIFLRQGKLAEAETALRAELRFHPQDLRAAYTLAVVLDLSQKTEEALAVLRALLDREPRMADGHYLLGKILLARGETEAALERLNSAASLSPGDPETHYQLGQALQKLGRTEEARIEFERFRRLKDEQRSGGAS